ncbi:sterol desaturase family protein [Fulvivirgaceae bacterium BMA10]|uniref:Sterol desaturase family protein n=1 Tax=Splendidivirga corallicola TaxID=3051826 RepID=A0ABT8KPT8_9BACT|nr:sterol desaturase family protein [Fulvivirgaceae bacterium BMA10]
MKDLVIKAEENVGLVIAVIFLFSVGLAIVEFLWEWRNKKLTKWRLKEMLSSFMVFIPAQLTEKSATAMFVAGFFLLDDLIPWQIPINGWTTVLAILVVDFLYYWEHRWEHEIRLLWSYHSIHHSSPIYNYTTALRVSFIDNFVTWLFFLPAIAIGFHPIVVLVAIGFILVYQYWIHTELIRRMGWFGLIFNTPSHHRVHHGSDELYLDKNYGAFLIIWDRMFGTFQKEVFQPTYGLTKQIETINPVKVHFFEYMSIVRDLKKAKNAKEVFGYLFRKPGWTPRNIDSHKD